MMWECKWHEFKKENPLLMPEIWRRTKLDPQRPLTRLTPRAALRGGLLELYRLSSESNDSTEIHFFDACSMYSTIARDTLFPIGDYEIILEGELQNSIEIKNNEIFFKHEPCIADLAHVAVLAPSNLSKPFLPYRLGNQTFYANCRSCLSAKKTGPCRHKSELKRRFVSVWTVVELNYSLSLGYTILRFYELYHYKCQKKVLTEFVSVVASQRLKNSNLLEGLSLDDQNQLCDEINKKMNFQDPSLQLHPSNVKDNKPLKQFWKEFVNGVFGRFALHSNFTKRDFLRSQSQLETLLSDPSIELLELFPVGDNTMEVEYLKSSAVNPSKEGCLIFSALINAKSRILLHQIITKLEQDGCEPLYVDTDSVLYSARKNYTPPFEIGPCLGQWKPVLGEKAKIKKFYSLGPRNYCLVYECDGKTEYVTKIKGLSIGSANLKSAISPQTYETYLKAHFEDQIVTTYIPQMRQSVNPQTKSFKYVMLSQKFDNELHLKRYILQKDCSHKTYSYGYNFKSM